MQSTTHALSKKNESELQESKIEIKELESQSSRQQTADILPRKEKELMIEIEADDGIRVFNTLPSHEQKKLAHPTQHSRERLFSFQADDDE